MFPTPSRRHLIYVSGAITPTEENPSGEENALRLYAASNSLFDMGYSVYCPKVAWFHDPGRYSGAWEAIMEMDYEIIRRCDGLYMLKNWKESRGAELEHQLALCLGKPIMYQ